MAEKSSIIDNVDNIIKSTYDIVRSVGSKSEEIFTKLQGLKSEIDSQQNNQSIPDFFKKQKIKEYLDLSMNFDNEIEKIFKDIEIKKAYFKSEAAEEK
jgi:hypothetical protein